MSTVKPSFQVLPAQVKSSNTHKNRLIKIVTMLLHKRTLNPILGQSFVWSYNFTIFIVWTACKIGFYTQCVYLHKNRWKITSSIVTQRQKSAAHNFIFGNYEFYTVVVILCLNFKVEMQHVDTFRSLTYQHRSKCTFFVHNFSFNLFQYLLFIFHFWCCARNCICAFGGNAYSIAKRT